MSKMVTALVAVGVTCAVSGCQQAGPAARVEAAPGEAGSMRVVDPGDFQGEMEAAASACPNVLTSGRISAAIETFSGWRLGQVNHVGIRGLAQLPDVQFARHAPPGSDPDDPSAAIAAIAGRMCEVRGELSDAFDRGEIQVRDWESPRRDLDRTAELVGLVVAGVMAGPQYVLDNGGVSVRDPELSEAMTRVIYA